MTKGHKLKLAKIKRSIWKNPKETRHKLSIMSSQCNASCNDMWHAEYWQPGKLTWALNFIESLSGKHGTPMGLTLASPSPASPEVRLILCCQGPHHKSHCEHKLSVTQTYKDILIRHDVQRVGQRPVFSLKCAEFQQLRPAESILNCTRTMWFCQIHPCSFHNR